MQSIYLSVSQQKAGEFWKNREIGTDHKGKEKQQVLFCLNIYNFQIHFKENKYLAIPEHDRLCL